MPQVDLRDLDAHNRGRRRVKSTRPLRRLVEVLRNRVARGEDAEAVVADFGIRDPLLRSRYLATLSTHPAAPEAARS